MPPKRRKISGVPDSEDHVPMPEEAMDMPDEQEARSMSPFSSKSPKPTVRVTMTLHTIVGQSASLSLIERLGIQALLENELDSLKDSLRARIGHRVTFDVEDVDV